MRHYNDFPLDGTLDQDIVCFHHRDSYHASPFHHHLNHIELFLFLGGDVEFFSKKADFRLHPGDLVIIPNGVWHRAYTRSTKTYDRLFINIKVTKIQELSTAQTHLMDCFINLPPRWDVNVIKLSQPEVDQFTNLCHQVITCLTRNDYGKDVQLNILQAQILLLANQAASGKKVGEPHGQPSRLQQLLDYIDDNLDGNLHLNHLAKLFYLNPDYLNRYFRREIGLSLHSYIQQLRIDRARRMLLMGASITDTATACGYQNYSSFIRAFSKTVGMTPAKFRRTHVIKPQLKK